MGERDVLITEIGAALTILGLLLVFLPLFVGRAAASAGINASQDEIKAAVRLAWAVPLLIALAAGDATVGLLTLWSRIDAAELTGWVLLGLIWLVVSLAVVTVASET